MKQKYIPAFIMLIAGAITSIIDILNKVELLVGLKRLLIILILFYIIGLIAQAIIRKVTAPKPASSEEENTEGEAASNEDNSGSTEE